ncbi:glycosyltransferase family 4 protein [Oceaniglobus indicus]|uniref:glycosyltransferase family 4 protein n=1 Tax=Oceaniglobus indicus TaxID=2047749 RepID=UPI000C18018E|nr:glycosyltransferase family 4 protein [Oceaniglobus indicus]
MRKIAIFSLTPSPPAPVATRSTLAAFEQTFADAQIDIIYVLDRLRKNRAAMARAAAVAAATYAPDLIRGRKALKYAAFRTPWIFRWIKREMAQCVSARDYAFSIQLQSLFDASVPGLPNFVYTDHTHLENLRFDGFTPADLYSRAWIDCERSIYHNATTVFTWSSNVSRSLHVDYDMPENRVECVYTGSNSAIPPPSPDDTGRYARKNILFVGVDWDRKGGPVLIKAFRRLRDRHPDARLTLVGDVPDLGDIPGVDVRGRVPLEDLPAIYGAASIFCMPTRLEPFGNVFVEAMWQHLPVVATRVGALPDIVEDGLNGFLVTPEDDAALADRLCALLDDPARCAAFGAAGRARAEARYDWPLVAGRIRKRIEAEIAG